MLLYAKLMLATVFWGGTFVAGRIAATHAGPFSAAFLRFAMATGLLFWYVRRREGALPRLTSPGMHGWAGVLLLGATGVFAYNALFFTGLATVPASRAAVIVTNNPIAIAVGAALFLGEPLSRRKLAGILLSVGGAVIAITRGNPLTLFSSALSWGDVALLGCLASWAAYSLLGKVVMRALSPLAAVTWSCAVGTVMLLPFALHEGLWTALPEYPAALWIAAAYLGVFGTVLGFTWFYEAVKEIGAGRAGVFINFVPLTAIVCAWAMLGEALPVSLLLGAALVTCGVFITNRA
ncbi:DMT family transporter [Nitratidesulfovibrio sp. SRB-5]|uniref:DMT family transporter n=1 Tax=Nitratidesulfovibrio sp. SRB-5 TaxID=2872636 RepID=UPI001024FB83|nr:DMT family transporter [Nitratidesulfovibrio sp. SRB-5]MBZ2172304.1 DMT family transporter [Nitratidesulfovibrio sp. SRB-5]RXF77131.1 DMT family transporter [Desulfovibrio sp. DS-1]